MTDTTNTPAEAVPDPEQGKAVFARDRAHVFHSWSAQDQIAPMPIAGASGSRFWDYDGNTYLDFASQLVFTNIGHQHPKVVAAIQEQAGRLCTIAPQFANDKRAEAAELITSHAPRAWTTSSSPTAARTRSRTRSGWPGSTPAGRRC